MTYIFATYAYDYKPCYSIFSYTEKCVMEYIILTESIYAFGVELKYSYPLNFVKCWNSEMI